MSRFRGFSELSWKPVFAGRSYLGLGGGWARAECSLEQLQIVHGHQLFFVRNRLETLCASTDSCGGTICLKDRVSAGRVFEVYILISTCFNSLGRAGFWQRRQRRLLSKPPFPCLPRNLPANGPSTYAKAPTLGPHCFG